MYDTKTEKKQLITAWSYKLGRITGIDDLCKYLEKEARLSCFLGADPDPKFWNKYLLYRWAWIEEYERQINTKYGCQKPKQETIDFGKIHEAKMKAIADVSKGADPDPKLWKSSSRYREIYLEGISRDFDEKYQRI